MELDLKVDCKPGVSNSEPIELYGVACSHFDVDKSFTVLLEHSSTHSNRLLKAFLPVKDLSTWSSASYV
jgi:hypothetical protein